MSAFSVYTITCSDESVYIGHTASLEERWKAHCAGRVRWTRSRRPLTLSDHETCATREAAIERESALKTGFGRKALKRALKGGLPAAPAAQAGKTVGAGVITEIAK